MLIAFFATSCVVADGNMERQPIEIGRAIGYEAHNRLQSVNQAISWALAADEYLSTNDESVKEDIYKNIFGSNLTPHINETRDSVTLVFESGLAYYTYATDGRLLSEGGKWRSWHDITIEAKEGGVYEVRSITEESIDNKYILDIHNKVMDDYLEYDMSGSVEFVYNSDASKQLSIEIDDKISYTSQLRSNRYGNRAIGFYNGKLNVVYSDTWAGYCDEVKLTYGQKNDESVKVEYLGDTSSFER